MSSVPNPAAMIDFGRSGVARYIQLASLFRRRIESGDWAVGNQIPTIDELASMCGVARATVRQALGVLEEEDLIERHRAKGTFVRRQPHEQLWCEVATDWSGLLLAPEGATIRVLSSERNRMPAVQFHKIGKLTTAYRYWRRLHSRNGQPYHVGEVYIDAVLCKRIPAKALETKTSMRLLRELPGLELTDVRQTLTVGTSDPEISNLLQLPLNAPVAHVHRSAVDRSGKLVFYGAGIYRGDVVRLDVKLK